MFDDLPSLVRLLRGLQQVPYLASKNIYRVASHFLNMDQARLKQFCEMLLEVRNNIIHCSNCFALCEANRDCPYCSSSRRDQGIICVVETWQELLVIEKTGGYGGVYHVLGGAICPLDGVGPENLTIEQLIMRIDDSVKEVILATNQTPEGEATASYIASKLKAKSVLISCLARGIPVGSSLEYMDRITVYKALSERRPF
ncbi:recombination protein RecR [Candidatus Dependentiae bacterium]|nr:MAG: recombination protein RecR [Candidatus Dependentiae bacterium]